MTQYRADSWSAMSNEFVQCPVPGCSHYGAVITKAHCRIAHNMDRNEVEQAHGLPYRLIIQKKGVG